MALTACSAHQPPAHSLGSPIHLPASRRTEIGDWTAVWNDDRRSSTLRLDRRRPARGRHGGRRRDFIAGVNLGATVPGHFPGELAVPAETYRRWFSQISDFGFTAIRVYTMLQPHFYEELRAHNLANPEHPLYLIHGAWPPEEQLLAGARLSRPDDRGRLRAGAHRSGRRRARRSHHQRASEGALTARTRPTCRPG